jgi:hypothetical protein
VGVERWAKALLEDVRPGRCPRCGAASRPVGLPVVLHGHGQRSRQVRGPAQPQGPALLRVVQVRRYRCQACGGTCTVAPWEVVARRLYSVAAVAWALALWGLAGLGLGAVRKQVSPWAVVGAIATGRWLTVQAWVQAVRQGRLLGQVRPWPAQWSARQAAAHVASVVSGYAPPSSQAPPLTVQSFRGAGDGVKGLAPSPESPEMVSKDSTEDLELAHGVHLAGRSARGGGRWAGR